MELEELRRKIDAVLDKIANCNDENYLIKLRQELNVLTVRYCNRKAYDLCNKN